MSAASFTNTGSSAPSGQKPTDHINALAGASLALYQASQQMQNGKKTIPNLIQLQNAVTAAESLVVADIINNACVALNAGCFAAGTKLLTRSAWRAVETIVPGEEVLSRDEFDLNGAPAWKVVEERFKRTGCILHIHANGRVIRTTPEHPFWVEGKGWTPAGLLQSGERMATLGGAWVLVEEVFDTQVWSPVYNSIIPTC